MAKQYNTAGYVRLLDLLPETTRTVLDIGCGTGSLGAELAETGIIIDGITRDEVEQTSAQKHYRRVWLYDLEDGLPNIDTQYEVVILSHVLEHIADPKKLMVAINLILDNHGVVLCAIPNMLFLYNRIKILFGKLEYEEYGLMDYTHVRWYTKKTIVQLFSEYEFYVEVAKSHGHVPLGPLRRLLPSFISSSLDRNIVATFPGLLAWELLYRFRKNKSHIQLLNHKGFIKFPM